MFRSSLCGLVFLCGVFSYAEYSVSFFNPLAGDHTLAVKDVSDDGQWFVGTSYGTSGGRAVRWRLGEQPSFLDFAYTDGINNAGTVAGAIAQPFPNSVHNRAATWLADGTRVEYPIGDQGQAPGSRAFAVNNSGLVAGGATGVFGQLTGWRNILFPDQNSMVDVGHLNGDTYQQLTKLNDNGWALGNGRAPGVQISGYIYRPGIGLSYLDAITPGGLTQVNDINNNNITIGGAAGATSSVIWNPDGSVRTLGGTPGSAQSINNLNQIAGYGSVNGTERGLLWTDFDTNIVLQELLPEEYKTTWNLNRALFVSDNGNIVANMIDPQGTWHTVLLQPEAVPEPLSLIAITGFAGLIARKRRKTA